jgi:4-amino-4-deoxy-L-arabinose transferase-like glycosyltransferase
VDWNRDHIGRNHGSQLEMNLSPMEESRPLKSNKWLWITFAGIMLLAVIVRYYFLVSVDHKITHDTKYYDLLVRQLLEKGVYAYKSTEPNAKVTPGFPLIMAAVYKMVNYKVHDPFPYIRFLNVFLSLATLFLIFQITSRLCGNIVGLLAAFMASLYPPFIWANGAVLTEVPAAFMLTLYLYVQIIAFESRKLRDALIAGALLGLTTLIRPEFMPLCVPLYLFYWVWTRDRYFWKPFLAALIGLGIVMSPWWIRNLVTLDKVILTATQTNPFTAGTYPDKNYDDHMVDPKGKTEKELALERLKVGFTQHTWTFVKWYTLGKLYRTYSNMFVGSGHSPLYRPIPLGGLFHVAIILSALIGLILVLRRWRQPLTALAIVIAVMSALRLLFVPEYRYNFTMMPLLIIFSAFSYVVIARTVYAKLRSIHRNHGFFQRPRAGPA